MQLQHSQPQHLSQLLLFEGEPTIKNSHSFTHMLVHQNQEIILFSEKNVLFYSYKKMLREQASLVQSFSLEQLFLKASNNSRKQEKKPKFEDYHMDYITKVLNYPLSKFPQEEESSTDKNLSQKIFGDPKKTSTSIMLANSYFLQRLNYLNEMRIRTVDISPFGDLIILLVSGRAILLKRNLNLTHFQTSIKNQYHEPLQLGRISGELSPVKNCEFLKGSTDVLFFFQGKKFFLYNYTSKQLLLTAKIPSQLNSNLLEVKVFLPSNQQNDWSQSVLMMIKFAQKLLFFGVDLGSKNIKKVAFYYHNTFIDQVFLYIKQFNLYFNAPDGIYKIDLKDLIKKQNNSINQPPSKVRRSKSKESQKSPTSQVQKPLHAITLLKFQTNQHSSVLHIDKDGNFIAKQSDISKQFISKIAETTNGVIICLTCKRNGNYKEGRLLLGFKSSKFEYLLANCLSNIKYNQKHQYLNFSDLKLLNNSPKLKKHLTPLISQILKETFENTFDQDSTIKYFYQQSLSRNDFKIFAVNLGKIFQAKSGVRHKIIQESLKQHYAGICKDSKIHFQNKQLLKKCIFSHRTIGTERKILYCKTCDVYGIGDSEAVGTETEEDDVSVRKGKHKCYICLNQMQLLD